MVTASRHLAPESFLIQPWIDSDSGLFLDLLPKTSNRCVCRSIIHTLLSLRSGTDFAEYAYHYKMGHSVSRTHTHHHGGVQWNVASKESLSCYGSLQPGFFILSDQHQTPVIAHKKEIHDGH